MGEREPDRGRADQDIAPAPEPRSIIDRTLRWLTRADHREQRTAAEAAAQQRQREDQARAAEAQRQQEQAATKRANQERQVDEWKRAIQTAQASDLPLIHFQMAKESTRHYAQREQWLAMWKSREHTHLPICDGQGQPIIKEDGTARSVPLREVDWASFKAVAVQQPVRVEDLLLAPEVPETSRTRSRGPRLGM